jgi:hypothetical protein
MPTSLSRATPAGVLASCAGRVRLISVRHHARFHQAPRARGHACARGTLLIHSSGLSSPTATRRTHWPRRTNAVSSDVMSRIEFAAEAILARIQTDLHSDVELRHISLLAGPTLNDHYSNVRYSGISDEARKRLVMCYFSVHDEVRAAIPIDLNHDVESCLEILADQIQDLAIEEGKHAWPVCPGHQHPMRPAVTDVPRRAIWRCPDDSRIQREIGHWGADTLRVEGDA